MYLSIILEVMEECESGSAEGLALVLGHFQVSPPLCPNLQYLIWVLILSNPV